MSVRRRHRRRHSHRHLLEEVFFAVFSLAFVLFGVATATEATGSETWRENVTDLPETEITSIATDSSAVASTDFLHGMWSAIDYGTIPSSVAYDYRTIPSSTVADDYRTITSSVVDDYRTIPLSTIDDYRTIAPSVDDRGRPTADMLPPAPYVYENHHVDLTEAADDRRPAKRPSGVPTWKRYPPPADGKRPNRYGPATTTTPNGIMTPPPPPPVYKTCRDDGHGQTGPPAYKTAGGAWRELVAPLIETARPLTVRLGAVKPSHWLLFALAKLAVVAAAKAALFAKALLAAKAVKLLLLPLAPLLWSWLAGKAESLKAGAAAKPADAARTAVAERRRAGCPSGVPPCGGRDGSSPPGPGPARESGPGPSSPYPAPTDPTPPAGPDPAAASSAFATTRTPASETVQTTTTTGFRHFRDRASVRSAHRPLSTTERFVVP